MQPKSDAKLLHDYAENGTEAAFTELVQRHTNLVYSAALRQVESVDVAAEITQGVFIGLARGAHKLAPRLTPDASLAGWLCRSARNLSLNHRRDEFRRLTRERHAMEQLIPAANEAPNWEHLRRVLDDAMGELAETDYDALVLRFFQNQDFRTVGAAIGVSDDTAQKRVARALEKLRGLLSERGIRTTATALAVVISANAVQAAPVGLTVTISAAALTGTAVSATTIAATATKTIAMTTLQKTLVTATVAILTGAGVYEAHQSAQLRNQNQILQQQQAQLAEQIQRLQNERDEATNHLAALHEDDARLNRNNTELLKLRGEVGLLRKQLEESKQIQARVNMTPTRSEYPADAAEQQKRMQMGKMVDGKNYATQLFMFADKNQGWLPTNWLQLADYARDYPVSGTNDFESVHKQPINLRALGTNISDTAVVREYMAWQTYDGKWRKVYGFADGHSQVVEVPDGNFTAWEEQNTYNPEIIAK